MPDENELGQEKTEKATPRRREKARAKGSVARSKEVNSSVLLFFALCVFALYGPYIMLQLTGQVREAFQHFTEVELSVPSFNFYIAQKFYFLLGLLAPFFLVLMIIGVVANVAQFGWLFTTGTIFQGLKNISFNPMKVIRKMFDLNALMLLGMNLAKTAIIVGMVYKTLRDEVPKFPTLVSVPVTDGLQYIALLTFKLALKIIVLLMILAILDFIYQKYKHEKTMKMSKEEVKDEAKMVEGDPKIRAQIRSTQMRMMVSSMVKKVPEADVVITNPFHLAVAVKYDAETMNAPTVVAKGARLIAERIKDAARNAGVPIIENKPLAQTLYKTIEVGQEVPPKLYQAVAEILAYVYKLNKNRSMGYATV